MKPRKEFLAHPRHFWANVRTIGQAVGYARKGKIIVPALSNIATRFRALGLSATHLTPDGKKPTKLGETLLRYLETRADILNNFVEPRLMDAARAKEVFDEHRERLKPTCPLPMNKQKQDKRAPAFLTGLVNMLLEANCGGSACDYDPRELTTVTVDGAPLRTLARRVDGAFPSTVNPRAIWEIKEYYYTTTFGSRVADGVYETLLDGMELEELYEHEKIKILHYLIIDAHYTWWECGKSYLCRIFDMLHMGYVDEVLFGYEVVERWPEIVGEWLTDEEPASPAEGV